MRYGASTFIWVSPFSSKTLNLLDKAKAFGFDVVEICVEDPGTLDAASVRARADEVGVALTVCGAFGPSRDLSSEDVAVRGNAFAYLKRCVDYAALLSSPFVSGPMYAAVGATRMLDARERAAQWARAAAGLKEAAAYAAERSVKLAIEPLNRFETDLVNTVDQGLELIADVGAENVGLLLDTFHMNIEEKDIPSAVRRAGRRIVEFHACSSDRGTPGEDDLPWRVIADALRDVGYEGPVVIEAFTPEIKEIARAVSIWRPLARSQDALAREGLANMRQVFEGA